MVRTPSAGRERHAGSVQESETGSRRISAVLGAVTSISLLVLAACAIIGLHARADDRRRAQVTIAQLIGLTNGVRYQSAVGLPIGLGAAGLGLWRVTRFVRKARVTLPGWSTQPHGGALVMAPATPRFPSFACSVRGDTR